MLGKGRVRRLCCVAGASAILAFASVSTVDAQSPTPDHYAFDSASTQGWPPSAPHVMFGPTAVVVEGIYGSTVSGCTGYDNRYLPANIEAKMVSWLNSGWPVITEITPRSSCGTLSYYKTLMSQIESYVEAHAPAAAPQLWAGIMLDEERTFWSGTYTQQLADFESLNAYTATVMAAAPGMSWYFLENQPNDFYLADTYAVYGNAWLAPQIYQQTFLTATNQLCATYGDCMNMVTIDSQLSTSWSDPAYVTPMESGSPWSSGYAAWKAPGWWNEWRPV